MKDNQAQPEDEQSKRDDRIRTIVRFWNQLRIGEETGATTWEVLDRLERDVTDALLQVPPDTKVAERITADAMFRIIGFESD